MLQWALAADRYPGMFQSGSWRSPAVSLAVSEGAAGWGILPGVPGCFRGSRDGSRSPPGDRLG
eukprot:9325204-Alexandrium_andersonii.AAC.1